MLRKKRHFKKKLLNFVTGIFLLVVFLGIIVNFQNVGGEVLLRAVRNFIHEKTSFSLNVDRVSGNPFKGFNIENVTIENFNKKSVLSVENINCDLSFSDLFKGRFRISEISLEGLQIELDDFMNEIKTSQKINDLGVSESIKKFPVEKINFLNSKVISKFGIFSCEEIFLNTNLLDITFEGKINGIDVNGFVDFDRTSGALAINKADINFGNGKILATGGILTVKNSERIFDLHGSVQGIDLKELTSLWGKTIRKENFDGIVNLDIDVTGSLREPKLSGTGNYKGKKISGFPVESFSANFDYANKNLNIDNIQAFALNVPINGEIVMHMSNKKPPTFEINLEGSEAILEGLDKVLMISDLKKLNGTVNSIRAKLNGNAESLDGTINFYVKRIFYDGNTLKDIRAQMKFAKSDTATVNGKFNFEGSQGYIQGDIKNVFVNPEYNLIVKVVGFEFEKIRGFIRDYDEHKIPEKVSALFNIQGKLFKPEIFGEFSKMKLQENDEQKNLPFKVSENKITFVDSNVDPKI